jgi:HB1, ASXL, restriction endonuclease HTH domain
METETSFKKMSATAAAADVLEGGPMHYRAITEAVIERGLWTSKSKTPAATINATLSVAAKNGETFQRVAPGVFGLAEAGVTPVETPAPEEPAAEPAEAEEPAAEEPEVDDTEFEIEVHEEAEAQDDE